MPPLPPPIPAESPDTLIVNGNPLCIDMIPATCQPPTIFDSKALRQPLSSGTERQFVDGRIHPPELRIETPPGRVPRSNRNYFAEANSPNPSPRPHCGTAAR